LPVAANALVSPANGAKTLPDIDLDYLARQNAEILQELRSLREEVQALRASAGETADNTRRNDPRRPNGLTR
jgi:hypothetical protein